MRKIKRIIPAARVKMGDIFLDQPLPYAGLDQIDPFLLIHHWNNKLEGGQHQNEVGVGPHPHRGFSPVTLIFKGGVHHRDSRGHNSIVNAGGTQWMNSGRGIVHSERPRADIAQNGGDFEIIQFWVNNPAKHKMDQPVYYPLQEEETPFFVTADDKSRVYVVSGTINGVEGKLNGHSPLLILRMDIGAGSEFTLDVPAGFNTLMYQLDGKLNINDQESVRKNMTVFEEGDGIITIRASGDSRAILLAGEPIGEKVVSYGPFVMNSQTEIMEALRDYQKGAMGVLIEEFDEQKSVE